MAPMNLTFLFPIVILVALVLVIYYSRRSKAAGGGSRSGLDDRPDATEPRELRGPEQWKDRH